MSLERRVRKLERTLGTSKDYLIRCQEYAQELVALSGEPLSAQEMDALIAEIQRDGGPRSHETNLLDLT
jgi:hypothetical protein